MSEQTAAGESIVFDRAADYYDRTRSLPPDVMAEVTGLLVDELAGCGTVLEIGVGTGRMALPLHEGGVNMVGLDLSREMLDRLIVNAGGKTPFPLLVGDATRLPLAPNGIQAALACHVFHLMPDWKRALDELVRVVSRGGVLLVDLGRWGTGRMHEITEYWSRAAGIKAEHPGVHEANVLDDAMKARGGRLRELPKITGSRTTTYGKAIAQYERGLWSFTWRASEEARVEAAEATRRWVRETFGDLEEPFDDEVVVAWRAYDL